VAPVKGLVDGVGAVVDTSFLSMKLGGLVDGGSATTTSSSSSGITTGMDVTNVMVDTTATTITQVQNLMDTMVSGVDGN